MKLITKSVSLLLVFVMAFSAMTIIPTQSAQIGKTGISDVAELGANGSNLIADYDHTMGTVRFWSNKYPKAQYEQTYPKGITSAEYWDKVEVEAIPEDGYRLKSISGTFTSSLGNRPLKMTDKTHFSMPQTDTTVKVEFEPNEDDNSYDVHTNVAVIPNEFVTDRPADCTVSVDKDSAKYNETVTVTVNMGDGVRYIEDYEGAPKVYYQDDQNYAYYVDTVKINDNTFTFAMPRHSVTVNAAVEFVPYKLTYENNYNGVISGEGVIPWYNSYYKPNSMKRDGKTMPQNPDNPEGYLALGGDTVTFDLGAPNADDIDAVFESITLVYEKDGVTVEEPITEYQLNKYHVPCSVTFTMPSADAKLRFNYAQGYTINCVQNNLGIANSSLKWALPGDTVSLSPQPNNSSYEIAFYKVVDKDRNEIEVSEDNTFVMPESDVYVYADFRLSYVDRWWNAEEKKVEQESKMVPPDKLIELTDTFDGVLLDGNWYVVTQDTTISDRLWVNGDVKLVLCDGVSLNCPKGINIDYANLIGAENKLTIYGQGNDTGKLKAATDSENNAAIGGSGCYLSSTGDIIICGGDITAKVPNDNNKGAAIGGGNGKSAGDIKIYGGKIYAENKGEYAAAIGGGYKGMASDNSGESLVIYGGEVTAYSIDGAAIGNGDGVSGSTGDIAIYGGKVSAKATEGGGAAIGGGEGGSNGTINIYGGVIQATAEEGGAGIGGGNGAANGTINIYGGEVSAIGCGDDSGAGIGGGADGGAGTINIYGGNVSAIGMEGAGIGGGDEGHGGEINISGGIVAAVSTLGGSGIGAGEDGDNRVINISGGEIVASAGEFDSEYDLKGMMQKHLKKVTGLDLIEFADETGFGIAFSWMLEGWSEIANFFSDWFGLSGGPYCGAAIGGGDEGNGGTVNITGGKIIATVEDGGANAIGHGLDGSDSGNLLIDEKLAVTAGKDEENAKLVSYERPCSFLPQQ